MTGAILALDLGTKMGYAVSTFDKSNLFDSGTKDFSLKRHEGGGLRYLRFRYFLDHLKESCGPFEQIVYEKVRRHKGTEAAHIYGGFQAELCSWGEKHQTPYGSLEVAEIKRFVTGRGNASKDDMVLGVQDRGFEPIDDNEADAIAILLYRLANPG